MKLDTDTLMALALLVIVVIVLRRRAAGPGATVAGIPEPSAAPIVDRPPPPKWSIVTPTNPGITGPVKPWGTPVPGWSSPAASSPPLATTPPASGWTTTPTVYKKPIASTPASGPPVAPSSGGWSTSTYRLGGLGQ